MVLYQLVGRFIKMENNFSFDGDILLEVKRALKINRLPEYLRYLSQEDLIKIYVYFSQKEQVGNNKYITESTGFLIMDKSQIRKK